MLFYLIFACKPIVAPDDYDSLLSFVYENFDGDAIYLEDALENLNVFLEKDSETINDGYRIDNLTLGAIQTIEERIALPSLIGISKSIDFHYPVDDFAFVNFAVHPRDVFVNPDAENEREYTGDPLCFVEQACEKLHYSAILERSLPLNIIATIVFETDIRWIDTRHGPAFIQKRWLTDDSQINKDWLKINAGYSMAVTLPMEDGNAKQIETVWGDMEVGDMNLPEDTAFILANGALKNILLQFEDYLDQNPRP